MAPTGIITACCMKQNLKGTWSTDKNQQIRTLWKKGRMEIKY